MTKQRKKLYIGFSIYFITILSFATFPPFVALWNTLEPHVFGLPFAQFSVILIAIGLIGGLLAWFSLEGRLNVQERGQRERGEQLEF